MKDMKDKIENYTLYCLEGISCLLVITIHIGYPGIFGKLINTIARFAVPLFFMVSGYYLGENITKAKERIKYKIIRLLKLCIISSTLYLVWGCVLNCLIKGIGFAQWVHSVYYAKNIIAWFFVNSEPIGGHLWFLYALLYVYLVIAITNESVLQFVMTYSPYILVFTLGGGYVVKAKIPVPISLFRNWFFVGLPFVSIGYLFRNKNYLERVNNLNALGLSSFGVLLSLLEKKYICNNADIYLGTVVMVLSLFAFAQNNPTLKYKMRLLEYIGKELSTTVYIIHYIFVDLAWVIIGKMYDGNYNNVIVRAFAPVIVSVVSIVFSYFIKCIITYCKNNRKRK